MNEFSHPTHPETLEPSGEYVLAGCESSRRRPTDNLTSKFVSYTACPAVIIICDADGINDAACVTICWVAAI